MKAILIPLLLTLLATIGGATDLSILSRAGQNVPEAIEKYREALGLSADQETKLKQIHADAKSQAESLESALRDRKNALEALIKADGTTFEAAEGSLKLLLEAEGALKTHQLRALLQLRDVLTPEQRRKAASLTRQEAVERLPLEARVNAKASRLKSAFDEIGIEPTPALKEKGAAIESLLQSGAFAAADQALDDLIAETGLDQPAGVTPSDFGGYAPGATDVDSLKQRLADIEVKAKALTRLPTLRQLLGAKDDLESAKAAEDADKVGRILTWAEGVLK